MREAAPCGLDSAPPDAAGRRRSTPPSSGGPGNFAAQRSRGMLLRGRGKFLLNGVVAKRHGPRRQVRVKRGCNGVRRSPRKELMPNTFGLTGRLWQGGTFGTSKAAVWPETFAGSGSLADAQFGRRYGTVAQPVRAGLTAQLTGRAENDPWYRWRTASPCLCGDSDGRGERRGAAGVWLPNVG